MTLLAGMRAVVFDAVGTLILPNPGAATIYTAVAKRHGITADEGISERLWQRFRIEDDLDRRAGWITSEDRERERWRNIVTAAIPGASEALFDELFRHFEMPSAWALIDGVAETLKKLRDRGFLLAMASNYDRRLECVVAGLPGLAPLRQRVVISSMVGYRKPAAEFFRRGVLPTIGCDAGEVLFVGDDLENDFLGAKSAGMRAVLYDPRDRHKAVDERIRGLAELTA